MQILKSSSLRRKDGELTFGRKINVRCFDAQLHFLTHHFGKSLCQIRTHKYTNVQIHRKSVLMHILSHQIQNLSCFLIFLNYCLDFLETCLSRVSLLYLMSVTPFSQLHAADFTQNRNYISLETLDNIWNITFDLC